MECARHPGAATHGAHCAACLLEGALASNEALPRFTIQLPLGETSSGSVLLVRTEPPAARLLRLKTVRRRAPIAFLERFQELQLRLEAWSEPSVSIPTAAWVDDDGHPWVLSEFRQGVPLLDRVRDRRLAAETGIALLARLREIVRIAHGRGLVHGSIVAGNVLVDTPGTSAYLLDFGFRPLLAASASVALSEEEDDAGFVALFQALRELGGRPEPMV
jgi:serine/threonine protein kinase